MIISSKDAYKIATKTISPENVYKYRAPLLVAKEIFKSIFEAASNGLFEVNFEASIYEDFDNIKNVFSSHPFEYSVKYKQKEDDRLKLVFTFSWEKKEEKK